MFQVTGGHAPGRFRGARGNASQFRPLAFRYVAYGNLRASTYKAQLVEPCVAEASVKTGCGGDCGSCRQGIEFEGRRSSSYCIWPFPEKGLPASTV